MHITIDHGQRPIRIVQLTDSHLGEQENATLLGMNTEQSLAYVIDMLVERSEEFDLILATGDIALNGAPEAYRRFQEKLSRFQQPKVWLAGNHDDSSAMRDVIGYGAEMSRTVQLGSWQLILLDSVVAGEVGGHLAQSELNFLRHCLAGHPDRPALIALHHHPMAIGCDWLDEQQVDNADELLAIVHEYDNVKAVCWGHVHQDFYRCHNDVHYMSAPSTCVQFAPNSPEFKLDSALPGVRWLELQPDGHLATEIWRLTGVHLAVNLESTGYQQ